MVAKFQYSTNFDVTIDTGVCSEKASAVIKLECLTGVDGDQNLTLNNGLWNRGYVSVSSNSYEE